MDWNTARAYAGSNHEGVLRLLIEATHRAASGDAAAEGAAARDRGTAAFKRGEFKTAAEVLHTRRNAQEHDSP